MVNLKIAQIPTKILEPDFNIIFYSFQKDKFGRNNMFELYKFLTNVTEFDTIYGNPICMRNLSIDDKLIIFNFSSIREEITFLDYIKKGIRLRLNIGIDFTYSNKCPDDPNSLHFVNNRKQENPYSRTISACSKSIEYYNNDHIFNVYGFGAIVNGETSYCFNINFSLLIK